MKKFVLHIMMNNGVKMKIATESELTKNEIAINLTTPNYRPSVIDLEGTFLMFAKDAVMSVAVQDFKEEEVQPLNEADKVFKL